MCSCTTTFQGPTFLSGDAWTRQLCWLPLLSFFSGVHTPGSVWVERSDSGESNVLFFQIGVSLFSVSLVWGKTKVSSSEPDRGQNKLVCWDQSHFTGREFQVSLLYIIEEGHTQAVTLDFWLGGRGTWAGPGCVFVFLQTLPAHLISTVSVTVYPTVWQKKSERDEQNQTYWRIRSLKVCGQTKSLDRSYLPGWIAQEVSENHVKYEPYPYNGSPAWWLPIAARVQKQYMWYWNLIGQRYQDQTWILTKPPHV